jgi:O-antigen/teichoic acid export membrane protein
VIGDGLYSLALRVVGLGSAFLLGVVLARALGAAEFGVYGLVTSVAAVMVQICLLGTPQLAVRELAVHSARQEWGDVRRLMRSFGRAVAVVSVVLFVLSLIAAMILRPGDRSIALYAMTGAFLTAALSAVALMAAELRGLGQMVRGQFMDIVGRPTGAYLIIGALLIASVKLTALDALLVQLGVAIAAALVSWAWLRQAVPAAPPVAAGGGWLSAAVPLGIVDVLSQFDGTYGLILVSWLGSAIELGIYRVAMGAAVLLAMPVTILHIVLAPRVARLFRLGELNELRALLPRVSLMMCMVLAPLLIVLIVFGRPMVTLVFGAEYADSATPLWILGCVQLVSGFFGMGPILLAMCNSERQLTRIYIVAILAGIGTAIPLTYSFGASGAALAQVVSTGLIAYLSGRFARRELGLSTTFVPWLASAIRHRLARDTS